MLGISSILSKAGIDEDTLVSKGVGFFIKKQEPDEVEFTIGPNGWQLTVRTDRENAEEAAEFWQENVRPQLDSEIQEEKHE